MSIWVWIGRHRRALKLGSVVAALVLCVGGIALGMSSASGSPAAPGPGVIAPATAFEKPSRHYLVGTVALVTAPGRAIVRGQGGRFVVVEYDRETIVRRNRQAQGVGALRRGTRVIILGEPRNGRLHADVITITGMAPPRQLPSPVAPAVPAPRTRPAPAPTRVPTRAPAAATPASSGPIQPATPTATPHALAPSAVPAAPVIRYQAAPGPSSRGNPPVTDLVNGDPPATAPPPAAEHAATREPPARPLAPSPPAASPPPPRPAAPVAAISTPAARHEATPVARTAATREPPATSRPSPTTEPNTIRTVDRDVVLRPAPNPGREHAPVRPPPSRPQPHRPSLPR